MSDKPILIMAGGTGGHVFPALAIADYLNQQGIQLYWLGTKKGLESRVVPAKGYQLLTIRISGLRGTGLLRWLQAPVIVIIALIQSMLIMTRLKPAAVLGMGGFVSGPGGLAAWLMRIPLCIHEQNAIAGLTNRLLAPLADCVMQAFPDTFPEKTRAITTGNPVRNEICEIVTPENRVKIDSNIPMHILVLGGSQGARKLNHVLPEMLSCLNTDINLEIRHQTGKNLYDETVSAYGSLGLNVQLEPFIENMAEAYIWADIVICRSGALTIAELAAAGAASILVPFPFAVDDHQTANAHYLSDAGAAILVQEEKLDARYLADLLTELFHARERLRDMAIKSHKLAWLDATRTVAESCAGVAYA